MNHILQTALMVTGGVVSAGFGFDAYCNWESIRDRYAGLTWAETETLQRRLPIKIAAALACAAVTGVFAYGPPVRHYPHPTANPPTTTQSAKPACPGPNAGPC